MRFTRFALAGAPVAVLLVACGGGGGDDGPGLGNPNPPPQPNPPIMWTPGVFQPSSTFEARCENPRTGNFPGTNTPYPDVQGSTLEENHWLRSWTHELYLWYDEVTDRNPANFTDPLDYFELLKTNAVTPSGKDKDEFHFTVSTEEFRSFSQAGVTAGYGLQWALLSAAPPRQIVVAYTEPSSPATDAFILRGTEVLSVDGVDIDDGTQAGVDTLNAGLFPAAAGETHTFTIVNADGTGFRVVTLTSEEVVSTPVQNVTTIPTTTGLVGYMLFNDHIATAESGLVDAIAFLDGQNVTDLVLDIRYNTGGFLDIASELAFMIAGPGATGGRTFERTIFNDKHTATDPVTGAPLTGTPFHSTTQNFDLAPGQFLPSLELPRVFVLTSADTCSASESIINSLRGIGVQVIQVGSTTCGKPYGFYPADNCGTTYFSIQFQGVNDIGFGDYADGFSPANSPLAVDPDVTIPGCAVADDFFNALGSPFEAQLAAALQYRQSQTCPAPSGQGKRAFSQNGSAPERPALRAEGVLRKPVWLENRILRQ